MGFLSKIWKGVKKTVKKIGKRIKKTFKSVMKGIGKLGIVGQIGMMFLMPYAMGALGSFFGTAGKLASWSTKLMGPNAGFLSKALGKTLEMVNVGGTWIKNAYTSVSTAITNGMDRVGNFFKGEGFSLSADRSSVFSADFRDSLDTLPTQRGIKSDDIAKQLSENIPALDTQNIDTSKLFDADGNFIPPESKIGELNLDNINLKPTTTVNADFGKVGDLTNMTAESYQAFLDKTQMELDIIKDPMKRFKSDYKPGELNIPALDTENIDMDSILSPKKEGFAALAENVGNEIKDFDIYGIAKQNVFSGIGEGLQTEAFYAVSPDSRPKTPVYNTINIPDIMDLGMSSSRGGVFNTITLSDVENFAAPRGNAWQASSLYNTDYVNSLLNKDSGNDWRNYMNNFAFNNAMSPTVPTYS